MQRLVISRALKGQVKGVAQKLRRHGMRQLDLSAPSAHRVGTQLAALAGALVQTLASRDMCSHVLSYLQSAS